MGAACVLVAPAKAGALPAIEGALTDLRGVAVGDWKVSPTHRYLLQVSASDGSLADDSLTQLVKLDADAKALVMVAVEADETWCKAHPDDAVKYSPTPKHAPTPEPSLCSKAWREVAGKSVAALIEHVEAKWGEHVLAYAVCQAKAGQWEFPAETDALGDYSVAATRAFREYLRAKYRTLPDFRAAWGEARNPVIDMQKAPADEVRPITSWDEVKIPPAQRRLPPPQDLYEPPAYTDVADYRQFASKMVADTAIAMAEAAKTKAGGKPVGVQYVDWVRTRYEPPMIERGIFGLGRVMDAVAVDFVAVDGHDGLKLHASHGIGHVLSGPDTAAPAQMAVVVDANSAAYMARPGEFLASQLAEIDKAGISYRVYDLHDLVEREFPAEKVIMFLNTFVLDDRQREVLATLRSGGRVLVFSYAAGAMRPDRGVDGRDMRDFTGLGITMLPKDRPLRIAVSGGLDPWTSEVGEGVVYGPTKTMSPGFCVVDGQADVLGTIEGIKLPGLAARRFDGWTSVYSAAPGIPAAVLKGIVSAK
jgi:hypothetical protein